MRQFMLGVVCGCVIAGSSVAMAQVFATVDTNGVLKGYTVQKNGKVVCIDPWVQIDFRGLGSFINCD